MIVMMTMMLMTITIMMAMNDNRFFIDYIKSFIGDVTDRHEKCPCQTNALGADSCYGCTIVQTYFEKSSTDALAMSF